MELAGKRTLTASTRGQHMGIPAHELHTKIIVGDRGRANTLLAGAFDQLQETVETLGIQVNPQELYSTLHQYCTDLLMEGEPHRVSRLRDVLTERRFLNANP
jgi:uridine phosphorylase